MFEQMSLPHAEKTTAAEPVALGRMLRDTARAWTRSFGVSGEVAEQRLVDQLRAALREDVTVLDVNSNFQDVLDQAAHDAIAGWFAYVTRDQDCHTGNRFAMLRCAFLSANRDGIWNECFLDRDGSLQDLALALQVQMMLPTPARNSRVMPRQSLERQAS
ncbi:hypothetical protein [Thalassospira sp.]|uniref:hypothetical protein n=1 Tax=Thalassospira sp. TaxID=1912094 RepID=UPI00273532C8|nr:hypothetical protein [Thalassospira sp.]MDP2699118.1 hypothetical protein [Thalassospira sp.]